MLADREMAPEVDIHDMLFRGDGNSGLTAADGPSGMEEAVRAEVVRQLAPGKISLYLKERAHSEWEGAVRYAGLDAAEVRARVAQPRDNVLKALRKDADFFKEVGAAGDVVLLVENCELIPVYTPRDIRNVFQRITR
jgi:hypothetical protein